MEYSLLQINNAITLYMGGPTFLKQLIIGREEEILITGPEDLEFHINWNWIMPVWKKVRKDLIDSNGSLLFTLDQALHDVNLSAFHKLIGNYCTSWCIRKQIKF